MVRKKSMCIVCVFSDCRSAGSASVQSDNRQVDSFVSPKVSPPRHIHAFRRGGKRDGDPPEGSTLLIDAGVAIIAEWHPICLPADLHRASVASVRVLPHLHRDLRVP